MKFQLASFLLGGVAGAAILAHAAAPPETAMAHDHTAMGKSPAALPVDKTHSFAELMDNADQVMHFSMAQAPRNGDPDHDFASEMIPHHQGAIDMAKVELLYGQDPVLRRMAQEIIVSQQQEIVVMQRRLDTAITQSHSPATEVHP